MTRYGPEEHDVLIVGGGGAGLRAAIAVAEADPDLRVAVISKVYPMRSHTVSAEGGSAAVIKSNDTIEEHIYDTISGGDWLCDQDAVESFVNEAPKELLRMEHWGCPWSREADGSVAVRSFGGMKNKRTWYAADKTGFHMLHTLFQTSMKYDVIKRYDEYSVTNLLVDEERCQGVMAIEMATGRLQPITARTVILCTGGFGKVFPFTTNANIKTGDGAAIAYRAGVPLKDMEFVQYHPTGLPFTGILITEATRAEGGFLLNKEDYRYLQDYNLGKPMPEPVLRTMELGPRDRLSQAFEQERLKGRTIKGPYGDYVHLDLRHLGEKHINERLPMVRELCLKYEKIDPVHECIPVRPVVHYTMGGIHTDCNGATPLEGLYSAGEAACVSINGANRLGSNSLTELLVYGARAGKAAAEYARQQKPFSSNIPLLAKDEERRIEEILTEKSGSTDTIAGIRKELYACMENGAGIYREEKSIQQAREKVLELQERATKISLQDRSYTFNTELTAALELRNLLELGSAVIEAALLRTESRGSHQRTDFPKRDDDKYLAHSLVYRSDYAAAPRVEYAPVTITNWPPKERVYG